MAGWFEALANMAGGLGQGLDRYTQMRQLDQENIWKRKLQQAQLDQSAQQMKVGDAQIEQVGDAILNNRFNALTSRLTPGQDTSDETMQALSALPGGKDLFHAGTTQNDPAQNGSQGFMLPADAGIQTQPGLEPHPTPFMAPGYSLPDKPLNHNQYMGTPQQNMDQYKMQEPQRVLQRKMAAAMNVDPQNPKSVALYQAITGESLPAGLFEKAPTGGGEAGFMLGLDPAQRDPYLKNVKSLSDANYHPPSQGPALSDAALAFLANMFNTTGQIPTTGGGAAGAAQRAQMFDRLGKSGGADVNVGALKGEVGANQSALREIQKKADAIGAFEKGATSNMKVAQAAVKQLQDFGAEAFNTPLRDLNKKFNDPNGNLANAALAMNTYIREYVRVTNNLGTGVLSDSARQEGEDMLKNGFTAAQFARVFPTMQQDMENVHRGFNDQIAEIKARAGKVGLPKGATDTATKNWVIVNGQLVEQ